MGCNSSNQVDNISNPTSIKPKVDPVTNDNLNTQILDLEHSSEVAQKEQHDNKSTEEQKENVELNDNVAVIAEQNEPKAQNDNVLEDVENVASSKKSLRLAIDQAENDEIEENNI
jgi:hypothetical protein